MSGKQTAVLWMGLLLVALRMFTSGQWQSFWSVVTTSATGSATTSPTAAHSSSENGATGAINV